ncbi:hypothetical protein F2P44_00630 [Massilia sp. CCM 8695]|uniref:Uncharacterized protein n=1 Tax=Massilia frigida TaxID=2609281 RepID=A0ABX0N552_9BURK|nr:hypothetical protein [Massilia frigida]NHZ77812.1 hypothetical protein [Massilia frigida]
MTAAAYENFRSEGYALAGQAHDLQRRVRLYQRVYRDSGKRLTFALIAAHGTLWASGYFKLGTLGARIASLPWLCIPGMRAQKLAAFTGFLDQFRSINRQVCAESYAIFYYTRQHGGSAFIRSVIGDRFTDLMVECHASCEAGTEYPRHKREALFHALIDWEQEHIVVPGVEKAFAGFDWPLIAWVARRPVIRFAYFGKHDRLRFNDFARKDERLAAGMHACRLAEDLGLQAVEDALGRPDAGANADVRDREERSMVPNARAGSCAMVSE